MTKGKVKLSTNLKKGRFTREELKLYNLIDKEIDIIIEYQEILPMLQQNNEDWIDGRILHTQLGVKTKFADWIERRINKYNFDEGVDFTSFLKTEKASNTYKTTNEYNISIEMAKQLTMVERSKIGTIARKYFIYIEKAFKNRYEWNSNREDTIIKCKTLKSALIKYKKEVIKTIPTYMHNNQFIAEFCLLNEVIIGMSAKEYRKRKGFAKDFPIRNSFSEKELGLVHILEQYDSDLIRIQNEFDYENRRKFLTKKLKTIIK